MLYWHGATLTAGADPVFRNVAKRTGALRSGLLVHWLGERTGARSRRYVTLSRFPICPAAKEVTYGYKSGNPLDPGIDRRLSG